MVIDPRKIDTARTASEILHSIPKVKISSNLDEKWWDSRRNFEEGIDYYLEKGKIIYTEHYLKKRGTCCGSGCRHCPFNTAHTKVNKNLREDLEK